MNEELFQEQAEQQSLKYRAVCEDRSHNWKGRWQQEYYQAQSDAERHWENTGHEVWIESASRSRARFVKS